VETQTRQPRRRRPAPLQRPRRKATQRCAGGLLAVWPSARLRGQCGCAARGWGELWKCLRSAAALTIVTSHVWRGVVILCGVVVFDRGCLWDAAMPVIKSVRVRRRQGWHCGSFHRWTPYLVYPSMEGQRIRDGSLKLFRKLWGYCGGVRATLASFCAQKPFCSATARAPDIAEPQRWSDVPCLALAPNCWCHKHSKLDQCNASEEVTPGPTNKQPCTWAL